MQTILGKWSEEAYVLLQFMMGFMIGCHGVQKVFGLLDGESPATGLFSGRRCDRNDRWPVGDGGVVHLTGGSHTLGRNGRRVFHGACWSAILAPLERRRDCRRQLLRLPLYRYEEAGASEFG